MYAANFSMTLHAKLIPVTGLRSLDIESYFTNQPYIAHSRHQGRPENITYQIILRTMEIVSIQIHKYVSQARTQRWA